MELNAARTSTPLEECPLVRWALSMVCRWRPLWQDHTLMLPSLPPVTSMEPPAFQHYGYKHHAQAYRLGA